MSARWITHWRGRRTVWAVLLAGAAALAALLLVGRWDATGRAPDLRTDGPPGAVSADAARRGAYVAQVGHCAGCHTAPGGVPWAGGRVVLTPFGSVSVANLTPDRDTGLGRWTPAAFRRALREGLSADGRPLLPACPYSNFSLVSETDADDLFAYLQGLPAQRQAVAPPSLQWPYSLPVALTVWRAVKFTPAVLPEPPVGARADWSRGAYLAGGLGHCSACHGRRDAWGANAGAWDFRGGAIPLQGWVAPSLADPLEAAVSAWSEDEVVSLLKTGLNRHAGVSGPMALVVARSTQHLSDADAWAMAEFLRRLPPTAAPAAQARAAGAAVPDLVLKQGEGLFERHCADCHGKAGEGMADAGPALAGNRAVALPSAVNVTRMVLGGGFGPATAGQPRPLGMPPYATRLSDAEIAAVVSHVRWRFGGGASGVSPFEVNLQR